VQHLYQALNAFCAWLHHEGHTPERCRLHVLKVEKRILQTLSDSEMQALLSMKPKRFDQWRLHALICLLLDTGLRIEEGLTLNVGDVDFDNLLLTAFGKGRKERRIPFSSELRRILSVSAGAREAVDTRHTLVCHAGGHTVGSAQ
jgi:site-specific recombinase XerD